MPPVNNDLVTKLVNLAETNEAASKFFEHLASRQVNYRATKARVAVANTGLTRKQIVDVFHELEKLGVGKLVVGRKGHETRFRWTRRMTEVGQAAVGEIDVLDELDLDEIEADLADLAEETDDELVTHEFKLRKDVVVQVLVPADLTEREAARLAKFIETLPI